MRNCIILLFFIVASATPTKAQDLEVFLQQIVASETPELDQVLNQQVAELQLLDSVVHLQFMQGLVEKQSETEEKQPAAALEFAAGWYHLKLFNNYARAVYHFNLCHDLASQANDRALMGKSSLWAMQVFVDLGMFDEALTHLYKIEQLFQKYNFTGFESITASLFSIGDFFYRAGNHQQAVQYFEKALIFNDLQQGGKDVMRAYNTLGLSYLRLKEFQRALEAFQVSNQMAREQGDTAWEALTYGNLGMVFSEQGFLDDAIAHLIYDLETSELQSGWVSGCHAAVLLAEIHIQKQDFKSAEFYLNKARQLENKSPSVYLKSLISEEEATLYGLMGKFELAFESQSRLVNFKEELSLAAEQKATEQTKKRHLFDLQNRELLLELERKTSQKQVNRLQRLSFALIVFLFLMATMAWLLVAHQRKRNKQQLLQFRKQLAQSSLRNLKKELSFLLGLHDKTQLKLHLNPLLEDLKQFMQIHEDNFYSRMKASFPNLHPEDLHVLALCKLKLSPEEIMALQITTEKEWMPYSSELAKKLGSMNAEAFQTFLNQL